MYSDNDKFQNLKFIRNFVTLNPNLPKNLILNYPKFVSLNRSSQIFKTIIHTTVVQSYARDVEYGHQLCTTLTGTDEGDWTHRGTC